MNKEGGMIFLIIYINLFPIALQISGGASNLKNSYYSIILLGWNQENVLHFKASVFLMFKEYN